MSQLQSWPVLVRILNKRRSLIGLLAMIVLALSIQRFSVQVIYRNEVPPWWAGKPIMEISTAICLSIVSLCILLICHRNKSI